MNTPALTPRQHLINHGWKEHARNRKLAGGYQRVLWIDPTDGEVIPQNEAYRIQISRNKERRANAPKGQKR